MAKNPVPLSTAKVNLVVLQMEGDSGVLAKGMEAFVQAFKQPGVRVLGPNVVARPVLMSTPQAHDADDTLVADEEAAINAPGDSTPTTPAVQAKPRGSIPRTYPIPKILDELNCEKEPVPFKHFVAGRALETDVDRTLAALVYLREHRDVRTGVTVDHVNTCFSLVGWRVPDDAGSLLRNLKKKSYVRNGSEGGYELTSKGKGRFDDGPK